MALTDFLNPSGIPEFFDTNDVTIAAKAVGVKN